MAVALPYLMFAATAYTAKEGHDNAKESKRTQEEQFGIAEKQRMEQEQAENARERAQVIQLNARKRAKYGRSGGVLLSQSPAMAGSAAAAPGAGLATTLGGGNAAAG